MTRMVQAIVASDLAEAVGDAEMVVVVVPSEFCRTTDRALRPSDERGQAEPGQLRQVGRLRLRAGTGSDHRIEALPLHQYPRFRRVFRGQ